MLKLLLLSAVVAVMVTAKDGRVCELTGGKTLKTFGGTKEIVKTPCKFQAVRRTICGRYMVTVTPGLVLLPKGKRHVFVVKKLFIGVNRLKDGSKLEGQMTIRTATLYLDESRDVPFKHLDGNLAINTVYKFDRENREVVMKPKNDDFTIKFKPYNFASTSSSTFSFECNHDKFVPSSYPTQLCGNGTKNENEAMKRSLGFKGEREALTIHNIFNTDVVAQSDADCSSASRIMFHRCQIPPLEAANLCYPLTDNARFVKCIAKYLGSPAKAFNKCVDFVCSNFTGKAACDELSAELENCPALRGVYPKMQQVPSCADNMVIGKKKSSG
ncbi:hypothetical protein ACOMHN_029754 [Nucella lapillus]